MNIVSSQLLEPTASAAPKPRARDSTQAASDGGFAAALERCADAIAPQPACVTGAAPDGRVKDANGHRTDDDVPTDGIAALLAGVVPHLALATPQPSAERLQPADPAAPGVGASSTQVGRTALQALSVAPPAATPLMAAAAALGNGRAISAQASAPGDAQAVALAARVAPRSGGDVANALDASIHEGPMAAPATRAATLAAGEPGQQETDRSAAATNLPLRSPDTAPPPAQRFAKAARYEVPENATRQTPVEVSAAAARRAPAKATARAAVAGDEVAANHARTAIPEPASAVGGSASAAAAAREVDPPPGATGLSPSSPDPIGPRAGAQVAAKRYHAPETATTMANDRADAEIAPAPAALAPPEHEHGSGEHARDHELSAQPRETAAALPAGVAMNGSAISPARAEVAVPVGSPEWPAALGHQLARLPNVREVELDLHPAELGPLTVKLSMQDGQAQLAFVAANAAVRDAIEAALPQLKINLAEHGIALGQTSVGSGSGQAHAHSSLAHGNSHDQRERAPQAVPARQPGPAAASAAAPRPGPRRGTIDAFV